MPLHHTEKQRYQMMQGCADGALPRFERTVSRVVA